MGPEDDQRGGSGRRGSRGGERFERDVRAAIAAGAVAGAASDVLRAYEAEVFGFLLGVLDDPEAARDVYLGVAERVATEIGRFAWRCPLRTWLYSIAHQELARPRRSPAATPGGAERSVPLPDPTSTLSFRSTGLRAAIATLRRRLFPEDRELLILSIDRGLSLQALAVTQLGEGASRAEIRRESIRLRARLAQIREDLAQSAIDEKLLAPR